MATHLQPDRAPRALGELIARRSKEIEKRWLDRVCAEVANRPDLHLTQLRDGMPDYLAALARMLSQPESERNAEASWAQVARDHGITRVKVGFDIEQLVHEFVVLRQEIQETAAHEIGLDARATALLADLVAGAIRESVSAYVERRDYEARCREAENIGFLIHELRNPLSNAVNAAAVARQLAVPDQTRALDILDRAHHRLVELIDSVLLTEKLEAGQVEPKFQAVQLADLIDIGTRAARKVAAEKQLGFEISGPRDQMVMLDPDLTRSALQNLVDNAVKYTDHGRVEVVIEDRATDWSIHVTDTGPGLSEQELRTIFEPFRRGATNKQGTGLGLAIARRSIEAQGGSIHAESPGDAGCHFWFTLPKRG